jgi:hypothetical protein
MRMWRWGVLGAALLAAAAAAAQEDALGLRPGNEMVETAVLTTAEMTGAPVFGPAGEQFGTVGTLVIDPQGKVEAALVDVGGGAFGLGTKRVALPLGALSVQREVGSGAVRIYSAATPEDLEAMPELK